MWSNSNKSEEEEEDEGITFKSDSKHRPAAKPHPWSKEQKMCLAALNFPPPNEDKTGLLLYRLSGCKPLLQLIGNYQINQQNKQLSTSSS